MYRRQNTRAEMVGKVFTEDSGFELNLDRWVEFQVGLEFSRQERAIRTRKRAENVWREFGCGPWFDRLWRLREARTRGMNGKVGAGCQGQAHDFGLLCLQCGATEDFWTGLIWFKKSMFLEDCSKAAVCRINWTETTLGCREAEPEAWGGQERKVQPGGGSGTGERQGQAQVHSVETSGTAGWLMGMRRT